MIVFDQKWEAGELGIWEEKLRLEETNGSEGIWCAACTSMSVRGISHNNDHPSGQKMYSKQTVYDAHLTSKKHIKATSKQAALAPPPTNPNGPPVSVTNGTSQVAPPKSRHRSAALLTHLCASLLQELATTLNDTKSNVERKFSLTAREREQELLEQAKPTSAPAKKGDTNVDGEEEEEEERIYNPLKLPLGWDGKPIPYWLYKLHGLGVEYRCEICSDHVYMGR
jgi:splicing factor 3A subunit 3